MGVPYLPRAGRCREAIYVRDVMRYTGRGVSGFEMHYKQRQCKRPAGADGYCWQHRKVKPMTHPPAMTQHDLMTPRENT